MGLGAPKRRNKLSNDPNNNTWSRSTTTFGHRILSQQGWQPGQYLGAEDAIHRDHYTAANASHIRISLREDNLGLGAKIGGNKADTFGLSLFSGVLGRLNGKSDEQVQKQQDALRDAELRQYQMGKHGMMNFISGGLLVGDRIQKPGDKAVEAEVEAEEAAVDVEKAGKKRKADRAPVGDRAGKKQKKRREERDEPSSMTVRPRSGEQDEAVQDALRIGKKKSGQALDRSETDADHASKAKKRKTKKRPRDSLSDNDQSATISADEKVRLKQEKRARKEDRRKRKEAKRLKKAAKDGALPTEEIKAAASSVPAVNAGRHAVRHRYIQQKRMAGMDAQAMKEIFMVATAS